MKKLSTQEQIIRLTNKYDITWVSETIGISKPYISKIRNGKVPSKNIQELIRRLYDYKFSPYRKPYQRKLNKQDISVIIYTIIGFILSIGVGYILYINLK
jgi:transcriptional regulator with XRE-family HTH domain